MRSSIYIQAVRFREFLFSYVKRQIALNILPMHIHTHTYMHACMHTPYLTNQSKNIIEKPINKKLKSFIKYCFSDPSFNEVS